MKILLVYPEIPSTFWSFKNALKFISKKSAEPPLGLITAAALIPEEWDKKLVDMNVTNLKDSDILWADYVFLSGMNIQLVSFKEVIRRCNRLGVKVVAGGPLATTQYKDFLGVEHFVLNEGEITLKQFVKDLEEGNPKPLYQTEEFPEITNTPIPKWELLDMNKYASMSIQFSRGCPYDCEFCSITMLNGRKPRTKDTAQFLSELERLYKLGWRGGISVVDDNFIGNRRKIKNEILPELIKWQKKRKYPFHLITEVSINLADDDELIELMVNAGFNSIFVGIESPNPSGLEECGKSQNLRRDLVQSVRKLQNSGLMVSGGFIVGFDSDTEEIFEEQISFIQSSGIISAMVGLLNAPTGTKLFRRLKQENRLLENFTGDNMDGSINFIPAMKYDKLIQGYHKILENIYSNKFFYERMKLFLSQYTVPKWQQSRFGLKEIKAFFMLIWKLGLLEKENKYFWKLFLYSIWNYPKKFTLAMTMAVYGFHFRSVAAKN